MSDQPEFTDAQITARYIELRDYCEAETKALNDRLAQVKEWMQALEGEAHRRLLERQGQSAASDAGVFFFETMTSVKVVDAAALHDWVFQNNLRQFMTAHVAKDPVVAYLDQYHVAPPGVTVDTFKKVKFRRA